MKDWPKHYYRIPFPYFPPATGWYPDERRWEGTVADRARISDPQFHGGKTEAIRLIVGYTVEELPPPPWAKPGMKYERRIPVVGEWIEFRNHKEANAFVQAYKRLSQ